MIVTHRVGVNQRAASPFFPLLDPLLNPWDAAALVPILIDPQGVFPNRGCAVIASLADLEAALAAL